MNQMNQMGGPPGMMPGNIQGLGNPVMGPPNNSGGMNPNQPPPGEKIGVQMVTYFPLSFLFFLDALAKISFVVRYRSYVLLVKFLRRTV